ncbi:MAG: glycoside hydrolase family 6 protein [Oligoflexus sp.]
MLKNCLFAASIAGFLFSQSCSTVSETPVTSRSNPLKGMNFYVDDDSVVAQELSRLANAEADTSAALDYLAKQPAAVWFGGWSGPIRQAVAKEVEKAEASQTHLVAVPYNVPYRDCGQYSSGGLKADSYRQWIDDFAAGLGQHKAVIILEPDAIPLINCLSAQAKEERWQLLHFALETFKSKTQALVYMDIGHGNWVPAGILEGRLREIGIDKADGFAINTSNYQSTEDSVAFGKKLIHRFPGKSFVIDTSRNGFGPSDDNAWCNPRGRATGYPPQVVQDEPGLDAYLWIKRPGESDGECNGGPKAGHFWPEIATELVKNSPYAQQ